ncbi:MAG: phospholipid carrier-dependent glycosyltransferase [Chloroflexia bacterium]
MAAARTPAWTAWLQRLVPPLLLLAGTLLLFAYLLRRFPYDGLYGVDGYAYYYQARALWEEMSGAPVRLYELFSADGLQHWPVGYHLHIIAGFLLSGVGPDGGRVLTLVLAAFCPVLVYLIVQRLLSGSRMSGKGVLAVVAGLVAGALLPLNATFTRMGLSLMSDAPTAFWALLSIYCFMRAAPLTDAGEAPVSVTPGVRNSTFALAGFCMGMAVLTRYGSALLLLPLLVYLLLASMPGERSHLPISSLRRNLKHVLWAMPTFLLALTPQALYLLTHDPGTGAGDFLSSLNIANIFASTSTSPDGNSTFEYPMIVFYLLSPLWHAQAGFYSLFFLPALVLGVAYLYLHKMLRVLLFLLSWWVIPAVIYAATPYQAHRFALIYLPAIAILIGCGTGYAVALLAGRIPRLAARGGSGALRLPIHIHKTGMTATLCTAVLILFVAGLVQCWNAVRDWTATHAAWQEEDRRLVALVEQSVPSDTGVAGPPRAVTLGFSAPLYHYTQWPVLELYFAEPATLASFLAGPEPHIAVVPEESLAGQWSATATGEHWRWLAANYSLERKGQQGIYTIYLIGGRVAGP